MDPRDRQARIRALETELLELKTSGGREMDEVLRGDAADRAMGGDDTIIGAVRQYNRRQRDAGDLLFRRRRAKGATAE